jgi:hypothetical protein
MRRINLRLAVRRFWLLQQQGFTWGYILRNFWK